MKRHLVEHGLEERDREKGHRTKRNFTEQGIGHRKALKNMT